MPSSELVRVHISNIFSSSSACIYYSKMDWPLENLILKTRHVGKFRNILFVFGNKTKLLHANNFYPYMSIKPANSIAYMIYICLYRKSSHSEHIHAHKVGCTQTTAVLAGAGVSTFRREEGEQQSRGCRLD